MPDIDFQVTSVVAAAEGLTPLMEFQLALKNNDPEPVHSILLHAQIQIQSPRRPYNAQEKENLSELFGTPDRWGQTLRNQLWMASDTTVGAFSDAAQAKLYVPCTYDLKLAATKYFYGLEEGAVPLLFLFSGSVFYQAPDGRLQIQPISWNKEAVFSMPVTTWAALMEEHFPNSAWLYLRRDVFDRLYAFKRQHGLATWEQAMERLLPETNEVPA